MTLWYLCLKILEKDGSLEKQLCPGIYEWKICEAIIETRISIPEKSSINNPPMAIVTFDDYHSLGKKIVYSLLKAYGYKIIDYGHGMNNETL